MASETSVFILNVSGGVYNLYRCAPGLLTYGIVTHEKMEALDQVQRIGEVNSFRTPLHCPRRCIARPQVEIMARSPLGVHIFTCGSYVQEFTGRPTSRFTVVHFCPSRKMHDAESYNAETTTRVDLNQAYELNALSPSGSYAVLCTETLKGRPSLDLQLLRFIPDPPSIETNSISLPSSLPVRTRSIEIDERRGVVYIAHSGKPSRLVAVRFA
jgi:hypothetical protein